MAARLPRCVACDELLEDRRAFFEAARAAALGGAAARDAALGGAAARSSNEARATSDALDRAGAWRDCCRDHLERLMDGGAPQIACAYRAYMAHRDRAAHRPGGGAGGFGNAPAALASATAADALSYRCRRCFLPTAPAPGRNFAVCSQCAFDGLAKRPRGPPEEAPRWL